MADVSLQLDQAAPGYKDLMVIDNDLVLTSDADPAGSDPILQNTLQRMRFFLGEWFLDNTQGLPWFQQILVKSPDQSKIDAIFVNVILGTPGVTQLIAYDFTVDRASRKLTVRFSCQTTTGKVNYSGSIAPVSGGSL